MVRKLLIVITILLSLLLFLLLFQFTDVAFRVWNRLQETHWLFLLFYFAILFLLAGAGIFLIWRIWTVGKGGKKRIINLESIKKRLLDAKNAGLSTAEAEAYLEALEKKTIHLEVAFFGRISTGKSALIQTLIPDAEVKTSIIGGSTQSIERYQYQADFLNLQLLDMPGTQQINALIEEQEILTAVRQVHIVAYVIDQDLGQSDLEAIQKLQEFSKPIILILNKISRYTAEEREQILNHLHQVLSDEIKIVTADSLHRQKIKKEQADGNFIWTERLGGGEVNELLSALIELSGQREKLDQAQEKALLKLADERLNSSLQKWRRKQAEALVKSSAQKAMLGGIAAVGPGTDVIVQGYLGVSMFQSLAKIYDISLKEMDAQILIERATAKASTKWTLTLALAGNVCKAFPGIGTVLGGASHAVAYGLIFESLGRAAIDALESGHFGADSLIKNFEEQMNHDLEHRAKVLVKNIINK